MINNSIQTYTNIKIMQIATEIPLTWKERLNGLELREGLPITAKQRQSAYNAIWVNDFGDKQFSIRKDRKTGEFHVWRLK